jgi:cholesterol transport system auxiliary component
MVFRAAWAVAWLALLLPGCLGSPPPVEQYLRVETAFSPCAGAGAAREGARAGVVAFKSLEAMDNLDRPAVLFADGSVLVPSVRWYWEGTPRDVMTAAVTQAVTCLSGVSGVIAYRPRVEHDAVMSGVVTAFNVQRKGGLRFVAAVGLEVWTKNQVRMLASREFQTEVAMRGETAADIAEAASRAATDIGREAAAWVSREDGGVLGRACLGEEKRP